MNLKPILQSEVNQKNKYHILTCMCVCVYIYIYIYETKKDGMDEQLDSNRETDTVDRLVETVGEEEGGMNWESSIEA